MPNHLANETSPYLLQHVDNPVDWYPWGDEALSLARELDRPILLSIGYAACHWCHVMAHESFEDQETADYMNQHFVNIKVDREERPDLDSIYMSAVQALTGQGGWPMTVVLTPEGKPFFGGTYFPLHPRHGMPSFKQVLSSVVNAWQTRRDQIETSVEQITNHLSRKIALVGQAGRLNTRLLDDAQGKIATTFDQVHGGFGNAPKFPPSMTIEFLLRQHLRTGDEHALFMSELTLEKMAYGGMYDQLGGGFARYSTDASWLVPHFEKMLYDNALLSRVYLHAWQMTGRALYRRIVEETLDFVSREMRHEGGGFFSSYDADSEGEEGKYYVWDSAEIREILSDEAELFMHYYDVSDRGNWEGKNILNVPRSPEDVGRLANLAPDLLQARLTTAREKLLGARESRVPPGLDDKVLTSWNGLMLAAFAEAGRVLDRPDYIELAQQNAQFMWETMRRADGRLLRTWKSGSKAKFNAYLEDYAFLADGLLALYQTNFESRWFVWAEELADIMQRYFQDQQHGGFYDTSSDHEALLQRPKEVQDNAIPSGNSMAASLFLRLSLFTGKSSYWDIAQEMTSAMYQLVGEYPAAFAHWLSGASLILSEPREVAIIGKPDHEATRQLLSVVSAKYRPNLVVAAGDSDAVQLLANRTRVDGKATAYVCRRFVCKSPVTEPAALEQLLEDGGL